MLTIILIIINRCSNLLSLYISYLSLLVLIVVLLSLLFIYTGSYYFLFSQSTFLVCVFFDTFFLSNNKKKSQRHGVHLFPNQCFVYIAFYFPAFSGFAQVVFKYKPC